jgi:gamma-glutamyltranspeptidase/glutathione hydrolase
MILRTRATALGLIFAAVGCAPATTRTPVADAAAVAAAIPANWAFAGAPAITSAPSAMVVTDAPLATETGVAILRAGGNAVDAAVATAFALAVVYPEAGNIGGGGFMVTRLADGTVAALDFREEAPGAATRDMFLDAQGKPTERSITGHLASGVPGAVAGLWTAHQRFGKLPWKDVVAPAIALAENGFTVDRELAGSVRDAAERIAQFPGAAALLLPNGQSLAQGSQWRNPDLAAVLRRVADRGPAGFYDGETADLIVAEMKRGGGIITHQDLKNYRAKWREPVQFDYRGHRVIAMPPASSGGVTLGLIANILEGYDLNALGWHSPEALHLTAEAMRRAFADRNALLGDPDFVSVPMQRLTAQSYADSLRTTIDPAHATPSSQVRPGLGEVPEPTHTTHFSIVDANGNAVALTTTINELYGSGVAVAGAGFFLNDEMDDFTSKPGEPNMFGLVQGAANAIVPGKRMLSAMTPTIVLDRDGSPLLVTGARGGPRIITAVAQVLINVIDYGFDIGTAVHAPRIHHQHLPDALLTEPNGFTSATADALRAMGHTVQPRNGYVGTAPSILRRGGVWTAVPDPRTGGSAAGY